MSLLCHLIQIECVKYVLNYSMKAHAKDGEPVVRNVLGSMVYRTDLNGISDQVIIPVEKLNNGMYFCSILVDDEVFETQRLVVNH